MFKNLPWADRIGILVAWVIVAVLLVAWLLLGWVGWFAVLLMTVAASGFTYIVVRRAHAADDDATNDDVEDIIEDIKNEVTGGAAAAADLTKREWSALIAKLSPAKAPTPATPSDPVKVGNG